MHAVVMRETGGPEVLSYEEAEAPQPAEGEVVIAVRAISVNPIDWKIRRGYVERPLPAILGNDVSGVVEESRAEGLSPGDEVFGLAAHGAYAEKIATVGALLARKPAGLSFEQAAALPVAGMTAWQALFDRGKLERGGTVVIAGAAGGVGHLAVQFARNAGVHAIGIGSARNRDYVLGLGAEEYVDYNEQDVSEAVSGVDVAFDAVGGDTTAKLVPTVREGGVLVTIANAPPLEAAQARGVDAQLLVMSPDAAQLAHIGELVASGEVRVEIAEVRPLAEAARAHELSESGRTRGKLILSSGG